MRRPVIEIQSIGERRFHWPQTSFYSIENFSNDKDVILVFGEEPAMKWKSYADVISDTLVELGVSEAVTLGAFFGQVAHTLPVPIFGVSDDPTFHSRHDILSTDYSGPTGITSVVGQALRGKDITTSGLWAAVPHYLSSGGYPKGMSALLNKMSSILNISIDDSGVLAEGQQFETKILKAMENSDDLAEYVAKLEEAEFQLKDFSEETLVEQIEDFLKGDDTL
jgi:proteasome assembly chaperone (PAC2) family protein